MQNSARTNRNFATILLSSDVDFDKFPFGGILSLLKDYLAYLPADMATRIVLVGITTQKEMVGKGSQRQFGSNTYRFLPVAYVQPESKGSIRLAYNLGVIKHYLKIKAIAPDVIYAHSNENGLLLRFLFPTKRAVVHFHNIENLVETCKYPFLRNSFLVGLYDLLCVRLLIYLTNRIIINIDAERFKSFISRYGSSIAKFVRIPPLINTQLFKPSQENAMRRKLGLTETDPVLVFHGRLEYFKGIDLVIDAMKIVVSRLPNARLLIIGDGTEKISLVQQCQRLGLDQQVIFMGSVPRENVGDYLSCADVFVTGTHFEMISVALLESIACGLLVVTTKVGGVNDIIVNGYNGFCVESRNPAEMAEKIMSCLEMDKTLARRNVLAVAEQFFPEKVIPLLIQALLD